ncbi:methionine adenosyltransferase [Nocardia beijingensis]
MKVIISESAIRSTERAPVEVVERKGKGHPDTLSDAFAEAFVTRYVAWASEHIGADLNHWVDKCMLIGGESRNEFGSSELITPIRAMVVGKATRKVGELDVPLDVLARSAVDDVLAEGLVGYTPAACSVEVRTNDYVGSGRPVEWFRPSRPGASASVRRSNDSVIGVAYSPRSPLEDLVVEIESVLTSQQYRDRVTAAGTDVKVLATRVQAQLDVVLCVPAVPARVANRREYDEFKIAVEEDVRQIIARTGRWQIGQIRLNTRDTSDAVYMAHLGSAIATGDVGAVGRGNRINGVIAPMRVSHLEAPAGKNPHYHGGKVTLALAQRIANAVTDIAGCETNVTIVAENGQLLDSPSVVSVELAATCGEDKRESIHNAVKHYLGQVEQLTKVLAVSGLDGLDAPSNPADRPQAC